MRPYLIGIAGPSGAGKSELARELSRRLEGRTALVSLDSYYRPMGHLEFSEREKLNWDHPSILDWTLIRHDLNRLRRGEPILEPVYLFDKHTRATTAKLIEPAEIVIVEGLFTLYDAEVRASLDARIFVHAGDDVCYSRRLARDTVERGRTPESVLEQYTKTVRPMAQQFVLPTQEFAELIVSGENALDDSWAMVRAMLPEHTYWPAERSMRAFGAVCSAS